MQSVKWIPDEAVAKFKEGVLTVELPRKMKKRIIRVEWDRVAQGLR